MRICGITGLEDVLCTTLTLHLFDAKVAMYGLAACHALQKLFSVRMCQLRRLMELAANALNMHASTGYVTPHAVAMIYYIIKPLGFTRRAAPSPFACLHAQIFLILFGAMRVLQGYPHITFVAKKTVCTQVFEILYLACVNNHENAAAIIRCGIVEFLVQAFQGLVRIHRMTSQWDHHREKLEQTLLSAQIPGGAPAP